MQQLLIVFIVVVWYYGNAIFKLIEVWVGSIIDKKNVLQFTIFQNSKIFDVNSLFCLPALTSEESMTHVLTFGIEMIKHHICIAFVTSSEHYYLTHFR